LEKQAQKQITLYSDGSSLGNPGPGGYGGILEYNGKRKEYFGAEVHTTNNHQGQDCLDLNHQSRE